MAPQANPTTPPRRPREPSPSTPGNKRQSRRLKAGQQALAGLTLGSLPVSASDTPAAGTSTQRTGEVEPGPGDFGSAYHPTDHSRPQYLRQDHVPPDGFQAAPLERRWRKALVGRLAPWARPLSKAAVLGARICVLTSPWGDKLQESLCWGRGHIPSRRTYWRTSGRAPGAGRPADGQPFFLDILHSVALNIQDPDYQFPRPGARSPAGGHRPAPDLAGHLATQEGAERGGPEFQELPHPTGRGNYPSADHFSELIQTTFLEEVFMGMVEGPFSKEEAASRCGCASADLCPDRDKIRTIYDGSVGGANDTRRWRGRRLRRCWMGSKLSIGYVRQLSRGGTPLESEGPQEGLEPVCWPP